MPPLRIGLARTRQTADRHDNRVAILQAVDHAAAQGVQVLGFPQTQTVGYRVDITDTLERGPAAWLDEVHGEVARRGGAAGMACVLGTEMPTAHGKPCYTALVISEAGPVLGTHHRRS